MRFILYLPIGSVGFYTQPKRVIQQGFPGILAKSQFATVAGVLFKCLHFLVLDYWTRRKKSFQSDR